MNTFFSKRKTKIILTAIFLLAIVLIFPSRFLDPARSLIFSISNPFQKGFYSASSGTRAFFSFLGSISDLKNENKELIKRNKELESQIASLGSAEKENEELRKQLELAPREKFDLEAVQITGKDSQGESSWIMIGKGKNAGIEKGMPVIVSQGILVGKVVEVYPTSARVDLLFSSGLAVNAQDTQTGAQGVVNGRYGLGIVLEMVEQNDVLNEGDTVVTSGLGSDIPKGLLIGRISHIEVSSDKLFQNAVLIPQVRYSDLGLVFVVK